MPFLIPLVSFLLPEPPKAVAIFPLDKKSRGKDIGPLRNRPGILYNVRPTPGPNGQPGGAIKFPKYRTGYVEFPNNGKLDTKNSITVTVWVKPDGPGKIFEYKPRGVTFGIRSQDTLYVRFIRRNGRPTKTVKTRRRGVILGKWNYIAVTYDQRTGTGTIWRNSRPIAFQKLGWIRLATKNPLRLGGATRARRPFRGSITCLQIYSDALTGPQIKNVQNVCFKPGDNLQVFPVYLIVNHIPTPILESGQQRFYNAQGT